ncbi:TlyA family RNA methyltransferase [Isoptericola jiangsuensis]|uniref:TlyA family RNA methyltransferase n=1 Tax=Isoptericola jiangsuensis TaxID=548579 RepID=UPI003183B4A9
MELVRRGLARSRRQAGELVAAGRVRADGAVLTKPSVQVPASVLLEVETDPQDPGWASRAGGKLAGTLEALDADPAGRHLTARVPGARCLDLGASTGGFTDVLLRRGASSVVALDVGHGQLVPALRADDRVTVVEGFNVRELTAADLDVVPDVVVGDLSFISLVLVLPAVARVAPLGTAVLLLVKPQFEVGRERLGSGGVVRDPAQQVEAVVTVARSGAAEGLVPRAVVPSPLPGPSGNREFFCWFERVDGPVEVDVAALRAAATTAVAWEPHGVPPVVACGSTDGGDR